MPIVPEDILVALAEPVLWQWQPDRDGGHWKGKSDRASYTVHPGAKRTEFDATPFEHACRLTLSVFTDSLSLFAAIPSVEEGKALCLRHAVSGDLTEISTLADATRATSQAFQTKKQAADAELVDVFYHRATPPLRWHLQNPATGEWRATGKRGSYTARFDSRRRWVIVLSRNAQVLEEHCFLTRAIAVMGCAYHSHTGEWRGTL